MTEKLNDLAGRLSKGAPKGLGVGATLLFGATAAAYGIYRSMFTGEKTSLCFLSKQKVMCL